MGERSAVTKWDLGNLLHYRVCAGSGADAVQYQGCDASGYLASAGQRQCPGLCRGSRL